MLRLPVLLVLSVSVVAASIAIVTANQSNHNPRNSQQLQNGIVAATIASAVAITRLVAFLFPRSVKVFLFWWRRSSSLSPRSLIKNPKAALAGANTKQKTSKCHTSVQPACCSDKHKSAPTVHTIGILLSAQSVHLSSTLISSTRCVDRGV